MTAPAAEVRFGRLERRGLLAGMSGAQVALLGVALIVLVAAGLSGGPATILLTSPLWLSGGAFAIAHAGGRPLTELAPIATQWALRLLTRRHSELARPERSPALNIPGVAGGIRIATAAGTSAAVIRPARLGSRPAVVVARVRGRGFLLHDESAQERSMTSWAQVLSSLGQLPHVATVQVLHRTSRDQGTHLQRWWSQQRLSASWPHQLMTDLVDDARAATRVETLLAIAVRPRRDSDLSTLLRTASNTLDNADVSVEEWLDEPAIRAIVRSAYDPTATAMPSSPSGGPMGVAEAWSHARSDSAVHATFWVSEWPRSVTHAGFLRPLLLAPGAHRSFSLIAQPLPPTKALREIRRARAEQLADAAARARIGQVEEGVHRAAADELTRREGDLIAGHGDLRFVGLIAVTAATVEELEDGCLALQASVGQAGCELRRLVGQQVQAFAVTALPFARMPR